MTFTTLQKRHEDLLARQDALPAGDLRRRTPAAVSLHDDVQQWIAEAVAGSDQVTNPRERDLLRAYLRYWATFVFEWSGVFPKTDLRPADLTTVRPAGETQVMDTESARPPLRSGLPLWAWALGLLLTLGIIAAFVFTLGRDTGGIIVEPESTPPATPLPVVTRTAVPDVSDPAAPIGLDNAGQVQALAQAEAHTGAALDVAFDPIKPEIATAGTDGVVRFWVVPGLTLSRQLNDQRGWVRTLAYSPYGDNPEVLPLILTGGNDRSLRIYDLESLQLFAGFSPSSDNSGFVFAAAFSPDGRLIASGHGDGVARIWDVARGTESRNVGSVTVGSRLAQIPSGATAVNDVAFRAADNDDGDDDDDNGDGDGGESALALALNAAEFGVQVMDSTFVETVCPLRTGPAAAVAYSPDGEVLAVGTERGGLLLLAAGGCQVTFEAFAHEGGVTDIAFNPAGDWLVTSGRDGTLKIWSLAGRTLVTLAAGGLIEAVAVAPNGNFIASAGADGRLLLWGVP